MKKIYRRSISGLMALLICFTTILGGGITAFAASSSGEVAKSYSIGFPRSGDANLDYSGTWGHDELHYMNGWTSGEATWMTTLHTIGSFDGPACYCIEPGVPRLLEKTYTRYGEDYWKNYPSDYNSTIDADTIKTLLGRIMQYGCPYVQEDCDVQEPSDNLVIYGHHMSNGSMFAHLEKFKSKDFWCEHRMITFNTLPDKQEYEIVAVFRTVVYTDSPEAFKFYRFIDAESANEFDDFIAKSKEMSFYDTGVTAEYGDKLITLSTCEYSRNNSRLVVVAKRITKDGGADAAKTHAEATAEGERPN